MTNKIAKNTHYELIVECCKASYDEYKISSLIKKVTDWDSFSSSAFRHGVFPLVYDRLKSNSSISHEIINEFKATNLQISKENILMTAELLEIVQLLQSKGIRTIVIKGPVLSQMIHGSITKRQFGDLDLLIAPEQMYEAVLILTSNGYATEYDIKFLKNKKLLQVGKDFPVRNIESSVLVEFHWRLFASRYIETNSINLFCKDNYHCTINNISIETLHINTMLLYLLIHGSKHYWERLEWILDIDKIIRTYTNDIDWQKITDYAEKLDVKFMFYLGLAVSEKIFQTPLEHSIKKVIVDDASLQNALYKIINDIYSDSIKITHSGLVSFDNLDKTYLMKNKSSSLINYYLKTLLEVNELDIYVINLPNYLSFLYYPIRFYRLFKQNILKIK